MIKLLLALFVFIGLFSVIATEICDSRLHNQISIEVAK